MCQYGWRIGSAGAARWRWWSPRGTSWEAAYLACAALALPAMMTALVIGEPKRHHDPSKPGNGATRVARAVWGPFVEFFQREGAFLVLLFILLHKIGDTLANLTFRAAVRRPRLHQRRDRLLATSASASGPI